MEYRLSDKLNTILSLSKEEAERLTHPEVTTEHLLLGIIRDGSNKAVELLKGMGVDLVELRSRLESVNMTPDARKDDLRRIFHDSDLIYTKSGFLRSDVLAFQCVLYATYSVILIVACIKQGI